MEVNFLKDSNNILKLLDPFQLKLFNSREKIRVTKTTKGVNLFTNTASCDYAHNVFFSLNSKEIHNKAIHNMDFYILWNFFKEYSMYSESLIDRIEKKGSWPSYKNYQYTYHYSHVIKNFQKKNSIKNYSLKLSLSEDKNFLNYYYLFVNSNNVYEGISHSISVDLLYPKQTTPFAISIDTEFVDKNNDLYHVFENKRISYPLSVSSKINSFSPNIPSFYSTYVFDHNNYWHLTKKLDKIDFLKNLFHMPYTPSIWYELDPDSEVVEIIDPNCFKHNLINYVETVYQGESNFRNMKLYFLSPHYSTKRRLLRILKIPIIFYFSIKDLKYYFGSEIYSLIEPYILTSRKTTFLNNSITSPFSFLFKDNKFKFIFKIELIDLFGINNSSLLSLAETVNVNMKNKKQLDAYKTDMSVALINHPNLYMEYAYDDVAVLYPIYINTFLMVNTLYNNFKLNNIPCMFGPSLSSMRLTIGALTAVYFEEYIYSLDFKLRHMLNQISVRLSRSDFDEKDISLINGLEMGSAKYLNRIGGSAIEGTFVSGGRTANESPNKRFFSNGLDADYSSCYGNGIITIPYCIGRPCVLRNENGGFCCSLREFLDKYKKELIPGCWYIVVGTEKGYNLTFDIDLLVSKNISSDTLIKKIEQPESMPQNMHISGDQVIYLNETKHSVIVDETLTLIKNIATSKELKELYDNLKVITAIFYPKKLKCESPKEFIHKVSESIISNKKSTQKLSELTTKDRLDDSRTCNVPGFWFSIEMKDFVGELITKRKQLREKFNETKDSQFNAQQTFYKLIINTVYGVCASRFFKVCNLCFANNVTGKARSSVWMLSKAFNSKQTITDGGIYEINKILVPWENSTKKPGFHTLTNIHESEDSKTLSYFKPLGYKENYNWNGIYENLKNDPSENKVNNFISLVDSLANQHLKDFYKFFNMVPKYTIEHKSSNIFLRASTMGRAHYYLYTIFKKDIFKIRGTQAPNKEGIPSPIYTIMKNKAFLDTEQSISLNNLCYTQNNLLKKHNKENFKKKLGRQYIINDTSLHSSVISKKTFFLVFDTGKYKNSVAFNNVKSKKTSVYSYCYLEDNCIEKIESKNLIIKSSQFWDTFDKHYIDSKNHNTNKRFSKNDKIELQSLLKKGKQMDNCIDLIENITNDQENIEENDDDVFEENYELKP